MNLVALALQYLPYVIAGVQAVETAIGKGKGSTKKALVIGAVQAAAQVGESVQGVDKAQTIAVISSLTDTVVSAFNATGVFQTGTAGAAAAAVAGK